MRLLKNADRFASQCTGPSHIIAHSTHLNQQSAGQAGAPAGRSTRAQVPVLLKGLIFGPNGRPMSPSHSRRRGRIYRYCVTRGGIAEGYHTCAVTSVAATDVEGAVLDHVQKLLAATRAGRLHVGSGEARERRRDHRARGHGPARGLRSGVDELPPAEQARIVQFLVMRVDVQKDAFEVRILRPALLSPEIVEAILPDRTDEGIMLEQLERPLPTDWTEQRRRLQ